MGRKAQTAENMLQKSIQVEDCLLWQGCLDKDGYGITSVKGIKVPAHRAMKAFFEDVSGMYVLHKCHNRSCINPDHLYLGTQKQNVQDQIAAGTFVFGSKNGMAKLTEDQVVAIKTSQQTCQQLADLFNVSYHTIWDILKGRSWRQT